VASPARSTVTLVRPCEGYAQLTARAAAPVPKSERTIAHEAPGMRLTCDSATMPKKKGKTMKEWTSITHYAASIGPAITMPWWSSISRDKSLRTSSSRTPRPVDRVSATRPRPSPIWRSPSKPTKVPRSINCSRLATASIRSTGGGQGLSPTQSSQRHQNRSPGCLELGRRSALGGSGWRALLPADPLTVSCACSVRTR